MGRGWTRSFSQGHTNEDTSEENFSGFLTSLEEISGRRCDCSFEYSCKPMGARITMFCQYYLRYSREEKDAFSR